MVILLLTFISATAQSLDLNIKNVFVDVENDSVIVKINYEVGAFQKLQVFLFGAMPIKDELSELSNLTSNAEFLKVGIDEAVFRLYFENDDGMKYFPGLELGDIVNVYINVSGTTFIFENTTKIPAFYYS